jgi:hypothetical protein
MAGLPGCHRRHQSRATDAAAAAAISTPGNQLEDFDWLAQVYAGVTRKI